MSDEDRAVPEIEAHFAAASDADAPLDVQIDPDLPPRPDDGLTPRERRERRLKLRRERKRQVRRRVLMIVAVLTVLVVFMYSAWPVMAARLEAAKQMDQAQALLAQAKPTVDDIDRIVTTQLSARATNGVPDIATRVLIARRDLRAAAALLDDAMPHLTDQEQTRAKQIQTATTARLDMLDNSPAILTTSVKAVTAKTVADEAWLLTQGSSTVESAALTAYKSGKASAIASASASLQRVKGQLADSRLLYSQAATAFPAAGFDRYTAYSDLRIQAVTVLAHGMVAWLQGDVAGAAIDYAVYRRAAKKAADAAATLPAAPNAPGQGFRRVAGHAADAYAKARQEALNADKALGVE